MTHDTVPVIDLGRTDARCAVDAACRDWGFFQIANHGIEARLIADVETQMQRFFAQPRALKRSVERSEHNPWGYYDRELTKNTLDWKQIFDFAATPVGASAPRWPAALPEFKAALIAYYHACETLALRLLHMLSENLGMASDALDQHFIGEHSSFARLNRYPVCPEPERPEGLTTPAKGYMGVNYHTDPGALTLLLQDTVRGLEVFHDGHWFVVEPRPDTLVVNIGDIAQVWSNDRYRAPLHRAFVNPHAERFSVAFFLCPSYATNYAPLSSMVNERRPPRYRSINWGEFYSQRTIGDYADRGEEIQISRFRIGRAS
jgi:isopenicillin N synthase-like dioxygenase